ncbi:hypothetical protein V502_10707 [Pseudogymnoascus sp. VKM F-4520 (FW-2644)]|nr:hypothetical protein V502_10707 [Pseudogymnoascus sp. VKM F-4520 (FW-2644)]
MASLPIRPVCEGVLGSLPLLGQFAAGFSEERARCESVSSNPMIQLHPETYRRSLVELGVIAMLQGEPGYAAKVLMKAAEPSKFRGPEVYIQALAYTIQCRNMQFKWSAAGSTILGEELNNLFDFTEEVGRLETQLKSIDVQKHHLHTLTTLLSLQRSLVSARPPIPTCNHIALAGNQGLEMVIKALQECRDSGLPCDRVTPFEIELAHLYHAVGDHAHFDSIVRSVVPKLSDNVLRAHHELRLGDDKVTTFGAPETWNMVLEQGTESNAQPRDEELTHFAPPPPEDLWAGASYYEEADALYRTAQYARGRAAVQLRLGYLATLGAFGAAGTSSAYETALTHVNFAKSLYGQAGDIAGIQVATAHSCLCRLGMGQFPEDSAAAMEIGEWGKERGSYSFAFGLGLFFAKYARRWLVFLGDYEKALAAYKLAAALFQGLELKLSYAYGITDQLSVYELLGERSLISITAEITLDLCAEIAKDEGSPIYRTARNHAVHVMGKLFQHANKHADPEGLARIADRLREWQSPEPILSVEQLQRRVFDLNQKFQDAMRDGKLSEMQDTIAKLNSLNIDPVEIQTQGAFAQIDYFISTAEALVPLYRSRKALRDGDWEDAERLWLETELALRVHPNEDSEVLLTSLSVDRRDYNAAAAHARAYREQIVTAQRERPLGVDRESQALLQRTKWQDQSRVLNLFTRVKLYDDAASMMEELKLEWGSDWWRKYEDRVWENLCTIAQINEGLERYGPACDYYEQAMEAFEKRRHELSVDDYKVALAGDSQVQDIYIGVARAATKWHLSRLDSAADYLSPHLQRAFSGLERGKARSLLDLIAGGMLDPGQNSDLDAQWQEYKRRGAHLATLRGLLAKFYESNAPDPTTGSSLKIKIQEKEKQLRELEEKLYAQGPNPNAGNSNVLDLPSLCRVLPEGTAMLQYCYSGDDLVIWKLTRSGISEVRLANVPEVELEGHVLQYHTCCETASPRNPDNEVWLAAKLLPFRSLEESKLIIVPYRSLHRLPFHALPYQGQPLIVTKSVSYVPSASVLEYVQNTSSVDSVFTVLAVGNPSNMSYQDYWTRESRTFNALPSAEIEAKAIAALVPGSKALTGPDATEEAVSAFLGAYRVLHFATHGSVSADVPMLSSIHLANGSKITVETLMGRRLRADLVVLSACETGRGELTIGEELIGFARALLAAGVKSVVVSLWPVNDDVTSFLMATFYKHLRNEWSPATALCLAQRATRQATRREVEGYLLQLRRTLNDSSNTAEGDRKRGIQPSTGQGSTRHMEDYSNPKFWAPFILVDLGSLFFTAGENSLWTPRITVKLKYRNANPIPTESSVEVATAAPDGQSPQGIHNKLIEHESWKTKQKEEPQSWLVVLGDPRHRIFGSIKEEPVRGSWDRARNQEDHVYPKQAKPAFVNNNTSEVKPPQQQDEEENINSNDDGLLQPDDNTPIVALITEMSDEPHLSANGIKMASLAKRQRILPFRYPSLEPSQYQAGSNNELSTIEAESDEDDWRHKIA